MTDLAATRGRRLAVESPQTEGRRGSLAGISVPTIIVIALISSGAGAAIALWTSRVARSGSATQVGAAAATPASFRTLDQLLHLPADEFDKLDVVELNLAAAREIPECHDLDVARYRRTLDDWAAHVKHEIDRHMYRFDKNPGEYKNSRAYFQALMMATVIGQDFKVGYDREGFSFEKAEDLFIHGVIDRRRGTCVSLPLLYIALGHRLGFPIRAVVVPRHCFCRWDDPATGERFNIEAANQGGLTDHPDEYYRHWPYELDPRWEKGHEALKSLNMRQHAAVMVGALASYFEAKQDFGADMRWDGLACWLDPSSRGAFVSLKLNVERLGPRFLSADELAGRRRYWDLKPHPDLARTPAPIGPPSVCPSRANSSTITRGVRR